MAKASADPMKVDKLELSNETWNALLSARYLLDVELEKIRDNRGDQPFALNEETWIEELDDLVESLGDAFQAPPAEDE